MRGDLGEQRRVATWAEVSGGMTVGPGVGRNRGERRRGRTQTQDLSPLVAGPTKTGP
jgi:hypothetical protein